jgi:hypothetical protein
MRAVRQRNGPRPDAEGSRGPGPEDVQVRRLRVRPGHESRPAHGEDGICVKRHQAGALLTRRPISTPWTAEQDEKLLAMVADGSSAFKAAVVLKRGTDSVRSRAKKLGVSFPTVLEARKKIEAGQP